MPLSTSKLDLSAALKRAIENSGYTNYALSGRSGVSQSVLNRFTSGERDITLETASKIAAAIGAELKLRKGKVQA
jgi:transcriptional regulator with XRE-family HTH domain